MNILTFDVEEWFHLLDNDSTRSEVEWIKLTIRIQRRRFSLSVGLPKPIRTLLNVLLNDMKSVAIR